MTIILLSPPLPIFVFLLLKMFLYRFKALDMVDKRMKVMNEVISGMKVIKMYTWESSFAKWITNIRE